MKISDEIEKGSAVFFKCTNPATGYVKRIAKDKSWVDVEWSYGLDCRSTRRVRMKDIFKLTPVLNDYIIKRPASRSSEKGKRDE